MDQIYKNKWQKCRSALLLALLSCCLLVVANIDRQLKVEELTEVKRSCNKELENKQSEIKQLESELELKEMQIIELKSK